VLHTALKLTIQFGGESIYFPKMDTIIVKKRNKAIIDQFDGSNYRNLSRKYQLSTAHIRVIINEGKKRHDKSKRIKKNSG
jgi:Mor family transcriptional regulator